MAGDPLERRLELLMLLRTSPPLTRAEIMERTGAYGSDPAAGRATFERDKRALRAIGVPIRTEIGEGDEGATRYWVDPAEYDLEPLALDPEARLALVLAAAMVDLDQGWDADAVRKLGGAGPVRPDLAATVPAPEVLPRLHDAVSRRARLRFRYRDRDRDLEPRALRYQGGRWYLVATDEGVDKTFRVDRIEGGVEVGVGDEFPAADVAESTPTDPLRFDTDDRVVAVVAVTGPHRHRAVSLPGARVRSDADGRAVLEVEVTNTEALIAWVLGLRDHAELIEPPELRDLVVDRLRAMAQGVPS